MRNSRNSQIQKKVQSERWGEEIAGKVFQKRRIQKRNILFRISLISAALFFSLYSYQNSINSNFDNSATSYFETIFVQKINFENIASALDE
ncbi:MAG: hypothetical protein L6Q54_03240 [Leptospiraceae bacterium]|nr:hypothetical protein [Leptospiraceae bacterium]MCK6380251.1 hypothetical protein [Leptospiraceae bacterium]NUM40906.1 hypothetical protein [Leptospiraceae bacterium]